ncbi:hypothetical protein PV327_000570 [Microctonus hyperodae]|uniref:Uncharacterized protein n=1 Tax=Microctonus hyperodae TaxID=165561 RepID=A0AA39G6S5_MICHY|nr:hypothetical protein PV327_000570 [Microctonus hyperodae]
MLESTQPDVQFRPLNFIESFTVVLKNERVFVEDELNFCDIVVVTVLNTVIGWQRRLSIEYILAATITRRLLKMGSDIEDIYSVVIVVVSGYSLGDWITCKT